VFDLSILKIAVLAVLAVVVFGPDKLPEIVADVMRFVRAVQDFARTSTEELTRDLPPEVKDLDLTDLRPKSLAGRFIESAMATADPAEHRAAATQTTAEPPPRSPN
jgi:sec-independent protein translocase protein TatB